MGKNLNFKTTWNYPRDPSGIHKLHLKTIGLKQRSTRVKQEQQQIDQSSESPFSILEVK